MHTIPPSSLAAPHEGHPAAPSSEVASPAPLSEPRALDGSAPPVRLTTGEWSVLDHNGVFVLADNALTVAQVNHMLREGEQLANAKLFAASKDLLAAVQRLVDRDLAYLRGSVMGDQITMEDVTSARAAIERATS